MVKIKMFKGLDDFFCGGASSGPGYFKDGTLKTLHPYCKGFKKVYSALADCLGCQNELETFRENIGKHLN